ncbi:MAG: hypothetical protein HDR14_00850 [Lachnospiraceae bacterium]|nr:hypothetical protein [Lachnospiraceae bacterium]
MGRELPILFNTDRVQDILDDRKKATRRIIKFPVNKFTNERPKAERVWVYENTLYGEKLHFYERPFYSFYVKLPYRTGDILYVRETWCNANKDGVEPDYYYFADTRICEDYDETEWIWRPSIHMPKAAARIWLKVTDVRAEQLQDMTLDDFLNEGVVLRPEAFNDPENAYWQARDIFKGIWDSTIPKAKLPEYGWNANPWVWVIEFAPCEKPAAEKEAESHETDNAF